MTQLVVKPVWQLAVSCKQTSNRLSKRLSNWFDNGLNVCIHVQPVVKPATVLQEQLFVQPVVKPGWTNRQPVVKPGLKTVLNEQLCVQPVVKPRCTTSLIVKPHCTTGCIHDTAGFQTGLTTHLTTSWMVVYTIQPVVNLVWQPAVSCVQPVVKSVVQCGLTIKPVVQRGLTTGWTNSCVQTFNRLWNPFDNRLYRVNEALPTSTWSLANCR